MTVENLLSEQVLAQLQSSIRVDDSKKVLDEKIVDVYTKVGVMLSRYRSGKIPKAFKIVPKLKNWEEILELTNPDGWTPNATYQATKIFISSLSPKLSEHFLTTILLPKIRDDISMNRKLNSHHYEAVKKSIYKPAAFFKGIVLGLAQEDDATLKEATIIASVLSKMSIPVLHSAATLMKLAQMPYSGVCSIFIKTLLDKKYALPLRVVETMVAYFCAFKNSDDSLTVLWHQSFLVFVERYKNDLSADQVTQLKNLISEQHHDQISAEILRELEEARCLNEMQQ